MSATRWCSTAAATPSSRTETGGSPTDLTDDTIKFVHFDDPGCLGPETPKVVASGLAVSESLELDADGDPVFAIPRAPTRNTVELRLARCSDPDCSGPISNEVAPAGWQSPPCGRFGGQKE